MATLYWRGDADPVAQVDTVQITNFDAGTTYTVSIGGVDVEVTGNTDEDTTASDLQAALIASTHIYFLEGTTITWTVATDTVTGTAFVPGVPFEIVASVTGGAGTLSHTAEATANEGPSDWGTGNNWVNASTGAVGTAPASTDDVVIKTGANHIVYGLDQNAVALDSLVIQKSFTGKIGMERNRFYTSVDGKTTVDTKAEYREDYLEIGTELCDIGQVFGTGTHAGSTRIKINNVDAASSITTIHGTASSGDTPHPAVRLLNTNSGSTLFIRSAPGGVGIAVDEPGETTTLSSITISDASASTRVITGDGVTLTTWTQNGGTNLLRAVAGGTVTTVNVIGGSLVTNGDWTLTTLNVTGGTCNANHSRDAGTTITTANLTAGTTNTRGSAEARTWATVNLGDEARLTSDSNITITTLNEPTTPYAMSITPL